MKKISLLSFAATSLLLVSSVCVAGEKHDGATQEKETSTLLACGWYPLCGDPDVYIYSPILQPKDEKAETQDTKDNKLA